MHRSKSHSTSVARVRADYYKDPRQLLDLYSNFIDLVYVYARNMLQKIQLQRVNRISKLTVGMLTQKEGRDCPSSRTGDDWQASPIGTANVLSFRHMLTNYVTLLSLFPSPPGIYVIICGSNSGPGT